MDEMRNAMQEGASLTEAEKSFNRQVNYYVMRYMWQVIRKRNSGETIYDKFHTTPERYGRVINTGTIRYKKAEGDELQNLVETTGMRREIFTGEARFQCPYFGTKRKPVNDITTEEWQGLFQYREDMRLASSKEKEEKDNKEKQIQTKLRNAITDSVKHWDFYQLCFFIRELKEAPKKAVSVQVAETTRAVMGLSFSMLDDCDAVSLQRLYKALAEKAKLVNGIMTYKQARDGKK